MMSWAAASACERGQQRAPSWSELDLSGSPAEMIKASCGQLRTQVEGAGKIPRPWVQKLFASNG